ncbi:DEP domain-containing protein 1A [Denticeps clupeoides]|uniref:DEP domain-containing protein 1A n=1 Tax=Denticeps clupeoides TaxID=299321 RepID=UPI0010A419B8|nr:DEP domain-containing protein 1A [Denticeps clupeoides]
METGISAHVITPGPYRATKLWNEVTKLFRAGMPVKKHRQHFRVFCSCFTAAAAVDWLHELLRNNSNFGPEVTRQQTIQLLKKFLKNHVIEDVKGRWGTEELEDNSQLYRFPPTSPLKQIPNCSPMLRKKSVSNKEKEGFFKLRSSKKFDKEILENVDPASREEPSDSASEETVHHREVTEEDIQEAWQNTTLTHLQKILRMSSLEDVLDPNQVNSEHIAYNMTHVNKHGVVTLEDKTDDLPHWVLSAMKCLANWPKYDSSQPSYPGFERDVFKTVSHYFCSLPQPLLTFQYYELFVNVLVLCGYVAAPKAQQGKRKNEEELHHPLPPKAPHLNSATLLQSTECLLMSLIRKEVQEENDSPMREVLRSSLKPGMVPLKTGLPVRLRPRSCSLDPDSNSEKVLFRSEENLLASRSSGTSRSGGPFQNEVQPRSEGIPRVSGLVSGPLDSFSCSSGGSPAGNDSADCSVQTSSSGCSPLESHLLAASRFPRPSRARSVGNCLDIAEHREMSASCFSINAPVAEITMKPDCTSSVGLRRPGLLSLAGSGADLRTAACLNRRCQSALDVSKPAAAVALPSVSAVSRRLSPDQSLLQPQLERVAIEALQLCTLLLPPASRRKLQLLMRMLSRMSQNVDMPRLHDAIGTRTLMVHTFSRCVLRCQVEVDLDELLASRLLSFLMDHHQDVLRVPAYLLNAVQDYITYLKKVQIKCPGSGTAVAYSFCRQISTQEFEEQKMTVSQTAIAELLESLIKDKNMSVKERKKRLKLFQKEYPEIYSQRVSTMESEAQALADRPKIKPPMLVSIKAKSFRIRN